ncbi:acyltransferase, partial [Micromonospora sp. NPDC051296]
AELMLRGRWRGPRLPLAALIFVATWVVASQWIRAELWAALLSLAYVLVIAAAADADVHGRRSPLRSRPMVWLGEVSFAFYLVHVFVIMTILRITGDWGTGLPGWWGAIAVIGFLLLTLALAALLHRYVEQPMMRRLAPRRTAAGGPPRAIAPDGSPPAVTSSGPPPNAVPRPRAPQHDTSPATYAENGSGVHRGR